MSILNYIHINLCMTLVRILWNYNDRLNLVFPAWSISCGDMAHPRNPKINSLNLCTLGSISNGEMAQGTREMTLPGNPKINPFQLWASAPSFRTHFEVPNHDAGGGVLTWPLVIRRGRRLGGIFGPRFRHPLLGPIWGSQVTMLNKATVECFHPLLGPISESFLRAKWRSQWIPKSVT